MLRRGAEVGFAAQALSGRSRGEEPRKEQREEERHREGAA
jgi:hypothetical protein